MKLKRKNLLFRTLSLTGMLVLVIQIQVFALSSCLMETAEIGSESTQQPTQDHSCCVTEEHSSSEQNPSCDDCRSCPVCSSKQTSANQSSSVTRILEQIVGYRVPSDYSWQVSLFSAAVSSNIPDTDLTILFQLPPSTPVLRI